MRCEDEMLWDTAVNEELEGLYANAFEAAVWGLVRLWLDAAYAAIQLYGCCYPFVYTWDKVCAALGRGYLGRGLTYEERLVVWGVLEAVQYPGLRLARKGVTPPDPKLRRYTRGKVRAALGALDKRGVTVRVGEGKASRRGLASCLGIARSDRPSARIQARAARTERQ